MIRPWMTGAVIVLAALGGCAGSPWEISNRSGEQLEDTPTERILWAYSSGRSQLEPSKNLRAELERREVFTAEEWERIDSGRLQLGDSKEMVLATYGEPRSRGGSTWQGLGSYEYWHYNGLCITFSGGRIVGFDS